MADPCQIEGCSASYNIGCRVVNNTAECVCPSCPNLRRPICASDDVQDLTECHMRRQACLGKGCARENASDAAMSLCFGIAARGARLKRARVEIFELRGWKEKNR